MFDFFQQDVRVGELAFADSEDELEQEMKTLKDKDNINNEKDNESMMKSRHKRTKHLTSSKVNVDGSESGILDEEMEDSEERSLHKNKLNKQCRVH